jgi:glutamate-1-semialdehyde aminotransferase
MQAICRELDILFIVDEVITGFGRTGPMFASEHEGLTPDLMTIAKGLTSGYAPMGATLVSDSVYDTIADGAEDGAPFGHGFTYSGHPISAAIGLEVLRLYQEGGLLANGQAVGAYFGKRLREFLDHPLVGTSARKVYSAPSNLSSTKRRAEPRPEGVRLRLSDRPDLPRLRGRRDRFRAALMHLDGRNRSTHSPFGKTLDSILDMQESRA